MLKEIGQVSLQVYFCFDNVGNLRVHIQYLFIIFDILDN